jgi:uncharacterized membrane protein
MKTKRSRRIVASVVAAVLFASTTPGAVHHITHFSFVKEAQAQAQMGQGIMQNIMPIMMLMMLMNMMQQNKGNNLQREQSNAVKNANTNLMNADTKPNGGIPNPLTNPSTNPATNPSTNPVTNPRGNPLGILAPK